MAGTALSSILDGTTTVVVISQALEESLLVAWKRVELAGAGTARPPCSAASRTRPGLSAAQSSTSATGPRTFR
jgi:hypothetical protein